MKKYLLSLLILVVIAVAWASISRGLWRPAQTNAGTTQAHRVRFYQDSMHPWVKSDRPGKCTVCGMDLTAIYEGQEGIALGGNFLALSSNSVTVLNLQTEEVKRQPLSRTLQVAGTLEANETKKRVIAAPAAGRIDELGVDYPGVEVREGQSLVTFYSPALTQDKLRFLVRTRHSTQQRDPSGNLSKEMDADPYYSDLLAPQAGTVLERKVTKGQYVAEGEKLFTIADASVLWFRFDIYEKQLAWVRRGQKIQVTVPAIPGKTYTAVISFIEPMLNEATRTVKVRADVSNPVIDTDDRKERLLRFGMYAEGVLLAETPPVVMVPRTAILYPGHSAYAYVEKGNGAYERRKVRLGREGNGSWEVLEGLDQGDRVVVSGNVLLDAQAQFSQGSADRMADGTEMAAVDRVSEPASASPASSGSRSASRVAAASAEPVAPTGMPAEEGMDHAAVGDSHARAHVQVAPTPEAMSMPMSDPVSQTLAGPASTNAATRPALRSSAPVARTKSHSPTARAPGPGLSAGNMLDMPIMDRWRERHAAELLENPPSRTNAPVRLSDAQCQSLQPFLTAAGGIAQALAADDLAQFNRQIATLPNLVADLDKSFVRRDWWRGHVLHLASAAHWPPAKDLAEARAQFLPFTINVVALAAQLKKKEPAFAGLKLYHCPMAPKPGLWMQLEGPLRNPFFGLKMQSCGEEWVAGSEQVALGAKEKADQSLVP